MDIEEINCRFCGVRFMYEQVSKPRLYCSAKCAQRYRSNWKPHRFECVHCGVQCERSDGKGGRNALHCSDRCRREADKARRIELNRIARGMKNCGWCLEVFEPTKSVQRFCCIGCSTSHFGHKKMWGESLVCAILFCACGRQILHDEGVSRVKAPKAKLCRECRTEKMRIYLAMRGAHKSRVRRSAVQSGECFTKLDVAQRWGSCCYLCGHEVSFDRSLPTRLKASLDHVVPLVRGGKHTLENCRLVHFHCNSSKGARMVQEVSYGR